MIPNKFAGLSSEVQPTRSLQHLRRRIEGFGFHEVIIEDHSRYVGLLLDAHVASIRRVYKEPYHSLSLDHRVNHITIFKNHELTPERVWRTRTPS